MLNRIFEELLQYKWSRDIKLVDQSIICNEYQITEIDKFCVELRLNTICNPLLAVKVFDIINDLSQYQDWTLKLGSSYFIDEFNQANFTNSIIDKELLYA